MEANDSLDCEFDNDSIVAGQATPGTAGMIGLSPSSMTISSSGGGKDLLPSQRMDKLELRYPPHAKCS